MFRGFVPWTRYASSTGIVETVETPYAHAGVCCMHIFSPLCFVYVFAHFEKAMISVVTRVLLQNFVVCGTEGHSNGVVAE